MRGGQELGFEHGFAGNLSRSVWRSRFGVLPDQLQQELAFPILTLGAKGTGSSMHQHEETWLLLLHGRKGWWISEEPVSNGTATFARRNPCQHIESSIPSGYQFCVQHPGEVVRPVQIRTVRAVTHLFNPLLCNNAPKVLPR